MSKLELKDILLDKIDNDYCMTVHSDIGEVTSTQEVGVALVKKVNELRLSKNLEPLDLDDADFEFQWLLASHLLGYANFILSAHSQSESITGDIRCRISRVKTTNAYNLIVEENNENSRAIEVETSDGNESLDDQLARLEQENHELRASYAQLQDMTREVSTLLTKPHFNVVISNGEEVSDEAGQKLQGYVTNFIKSIVVFNENGDLQLNEEVAATLEVDSKDVIINTISIVKPYLAAINLDQVTNQSMNAVAQLELIEKALANIGLIAFNDAKELTPSGAAIGELVGTVVAVVANIICRGLGVALTSNDEPQAQPIVE